MDAIICSRISKKPHYIPSNLNHWAQDKIYYIIFGLLLTIHEIIEESFFNNGVPVYLIIKPVLTALFFIVFYFIKKHTAKAIAPEQKSRQQLLLIVGNDAFQIAGLLVIMLVDGVDTFTDNDPIDIYFHTSKFWLYLVFGILTFFMLASKVCYLVVLLCFQVVRLSILARPVYWHVIIQTILIGIAAVLILFLSDRTRNNNNSTYISVKNQERAWRHVLEFLKEGVTIIDKNGEYVFGNRCVNKILGYEPHLSELNYNVDLSKVKNIRFHSEIKAQSSKSRTNTPSPGADSHLFENQLLSINLERTATLKDLLDYLRSKWVNTVDLLRKLSTENGGCLHLDGEIDDQGTKTYVEARITILSYEDKNNLLVALTDVTAKNTLTWVREGDKSRDKMIATVSHQLLYPLNGSINYVRGAVENIVTPGPIKEEFLYPALTSMQFLTNTINDLVDLFNINSNSLRMKYTEHTLLDTVREALSLIDVQAEKKGISIIKNFEISPKMLCYTDHQRLTQILLSLLSTALKYTFRGSITLSIIKTSYKDFMITIQDTGIGLRDEEKKKILDEKGKIKSISFTHSEQFAESEISLMVTNELARKLGPIALPNSCGVFCESELDKGSCFRFIIEDKSYSHKIESGDHYKINIIEDLKMRSYDLESEDSLMGVPYSTEYNLTPKFIWEDTALTKAKSSTMKALKNRRSSRKSVLNGRRGSSFRKLGQCSCPEVLLIDDDVFSMTSLEQIMRICHFSTTSCFNGLEGIREIMRRNERKCGKKCIFFKLIFVEMNMPVMGGEEFMSTIKDLMNKHEIPDTPIVACLKTQDVTALRKAREGGAMEWIIKPVSKEKVLDVLQRIDIN